MEDKLYPYGKLNDAVIKEVKYIYPGSNDDNSAKRVIVLVDCKDDTSQEWDRIAIEFKNVSSFVLRERKSTNQIIDEVQIISISPEKYLFDFAQGDFINDEYVSDFYLCFTEMSVSVISRL